MIQVHIIILALGLLIFIFVRKYKILRIEIQKMIQAKKDEVKKQVQKSKQDEKLIKESIHFQDSTRRPLSDMNYLLKKAELFLAKNDYIEAEKLFIQVLVIDSENLQSNKQLALLYLLTNRDRKAEVIYKKLADKEVKDPSIYTNWGLSLYNQSKYDEAINAYKQAIILDPHRAARYINLGQVFFITRRFDQALENFKRATDLEPRNLEYLLMLADTYKEIEEYKKALSSYYKLLELDPYNEEIQNEIKVVESILKVQKK
jgi:tetratricopeptide (TPR) repeat protein